MIENILTTFLATLPKVLVMHSYGNAYKIASIIWFKMDSGTLVQIRNFQRVIDLIFQTKFGV